MKLLKKIANFFRALFSPKREEGSPHKKVGYIVDQLKIVIDTVESYKLTYATVEMNISSNEDIEEIKKELDKRTLGILQLRTEGSLSFHDRR